MHFSAASVIQFAGFSCLLASCHPFIAKGGMQMQRTGIQLLRGLAQQLAGGLSYHPCAVHEAGIMGAARVGSAWHAHSAASQHASIHTSTVTCISASPSPHDGNGDKASGEAHPYFPRIASANPYQVHLEKAEVSKAWDGLMDSAWSELHDSGPTVIQRLALQRPFATLRRALFRGLAARVSDVSTQMVQNEIEESFDRDEFLSGVEGAIAAVVERISTQDFAGLKELCSEKLADRLRVAVEELKENQHLVLHSMELGKVRALHLQTINLWTAENIAIFDERWAKEVSPATSGSWLVATVEVDCDIKASYKSADSGQDDAAEPTHTQELLRQGSWLFVRGPLPKGVVSQLQLPWRVVSWW